MIYQIMRINEENWMSIAAILIAFFGASFFLRITRNFLPTDRGRDFAYNGKKSAGKPRGAGIIIVSVFCAVSLLFIPLKLELIVYYILIFAAMLSGFLDDRSAKPWGEYTKGFIDFIISLITALTYVNFNGTQISLPFVSNPVLVSSPAFIALATILIWISINVTNCSDGIDGLSGILSIVILASIAFVMTIQSQDIFMYKTIVIMIFCIMAYLWINAEPSTLIMGDAGSRAIGLFIATCILKTQSPLLYILLAFILIFDGLPGLIKIFFLRFFKIRLFKDIRTPIHDHVRFNLHWSNTQTIFRFTITQIIISVITIFAVIRQ